MRQPHNFKKGRIHTTGLEKLLNMVGMPHLHQFDSRLQCDGVEHYYPCVLRDCNARQYFCKHLRNDRHCPRVRV